MKLMKQTKNFFSYIFCKNVNVYFTSEHTCAENKHMQKNLPDSENHFTYDLRA